MPILLKIAFTFLALFSIHSAFPTPAAARPESDYQRQWCNSVDGQIEVTLPDGTRCDCVTQTHAVEIEFSRKWKEAVGQALWYAAQTGKRAGIVLIMGNNETSEKHWVQLNSLVDTYNLPITLWRMP